MHCSSKPGQCSERQWSAVRLQCSAMKRYISAVYFYGVLKASVNTSPPWGAGGHCVQAVLCPLYCTKDKILCTVLYKGYNSVDCVVYRMQLIACMFYKIQYIALYCIQYTILCIVLYTWYNTMQCIVYTIQNSELFCIQYIIQCIVSYIWYYKCTVLYTGYKKMHSILWKIKFRGLYCI